ncbi:cysteine proteinase [Wolfiporia cocos MD-104 SS10]|uniref:ubiquitinyl hydrolase 1 n=1 Tax=Wolfiporia cocos (strain MD-104) TaxID=742152 RepID=A0A2H3J7P7_WOLCO|nr:cysteine proteinase [Wolfiporia cocos MD-104 SS10]
MSEHTAAEPYDRDLVGGPFAVIESDPGSVFTTLIQKLGVQGLELIELFDIDPWAVDYLQIHGLIFCFLCTDNSNDESEDIDDPDAEQVWFANQLSDDACASLAILNVLMNCSGVDVGEELRELARDTAVMSPMVTQHTATRPADVRGAIHAVASTAVETYTEVADSKSNDKPTSAAPVKKRKTSPSKRKPSSNANAQQETYHYIGYVPAHGRVWELDGMRACALEVGALAPGESWMDVVRPALRMRMQMGNMGTNTGTSGHIQYNLLALVDDRYCAASDELELLKRERAALERRLGEAFPEPEGWTGKVRASAPSAPSVHTQSLMYEGLEREIAVLDMPARALPAAWDGCVRSAMVARGAVEDEIARSREAHTDHLRRTFDYEPFVTQFIKCLHEEGLLDGVLTRASGAGAGSGSGSATAGQVQGTAKPKGKGRGRGGGRGRGKK